MNNYAVSKTGEIESRGLYIQPCVLYIFLVGIIGIAIIAMTISRFNDLFRKHALLKIHNTEMSEQLGSLKIAETEMTAKLAALKTQMESLIAESTTRMSEQLVSMKTSTKDITKLLGELDDDIQELAQTVESIVENNEISTKIQHTVSNITKYFEFFEKLSGYIGEEKCYQMFGGICIPLSKLTDYNDHIKYRRVFNIGLRYINPFIHTPILMKHFSKYYHKTQDCFLPLTNKVYGGVGNNSPKIHTKNLDGMLAACNIPNHNVFTSESCRISYGAGFSFDGTPHRIHSYFTTINRGNTQLLHETSEDFELKFLENVLIELEEIYMFYKQCEMVGIKKGLDLPDEFDSM